MAASLCVCIRKKLPVAGSVGLHFCLQEGGNVRLVWIHERSWLEPLISKVSYPHQVDSAAIL